MHHYCICQSRTDGGPKEPRTNFQQVAEDLCRQNFQQLVRELFELEFARNGGEVRVTQASRDGGVDAVIFDPDPLRGGKIIV